jgi:hypothetical protein
MRKWPEVSGIKVRIILVMVKRKVERWILRGKERSNYLKEIV